jgi:asparagine synthase (glutamine-hydrolysing)
MQDVVPMARAMTHRGPDDEGYHISENIGLGFRRLSIIDLQGGHQPMSNEDESIWTVFNGEIFNFLEVRAELESLGYRFRTKSDTEVIVHGYSHWGDNVLEKLNGMFGLAIWDVHRRRLILARDRMGVKAVYYAITDGRLFFGSEIRAILPALPEQPAVDPCAIASFLRYRYIPSPETILKGIKKLPAGTCLIVEEGQEPRVQRWWRFSPEPFDRMPSDAKAQEELLDIYTQAVKRHLISDVPVGLLLSGGIDSALLLALMRRVEGSRQTYSIGYGTDFADDELRDASRTAELLDATNASVLISPSEFEANLETVICALEEPVATSSIVPMYFVCKRARQDVTVALVGQGPDELFGGYQRHLGVQYGVYWRNLPKAARRIAGTALGYVTRNEAVARVAYSLDVEDRLRRYQHVFSLLPEESLRALFRDDIVQDSFDQMPGIWQELWPFMERTDELGGLQFLEIRSSLPDELLLYADKLSMAHSLELRVPYLDKNIVEYVERLDATFKIRYGTRKWLHRRVARQFLPTEVLNRKKKGFATNVVDDWLRQSVSPLFEGIFASDESLIYRYLDAYRVRKLLQDHKEGGADNHKVLFSIVVLELLLRRYEFPDSQTLRRADSYAWQTGS